MLKYSEITTVHKLKDAVIKVSETKVKQAICEIFSIEFEFISECLEQFFIKNIKLLHLKNSDLKQKLKKKSLPIDWEPQSASTCSKLTIEIDSFNFEQVNIH